MTKRKRRHLDGISDARYRKLVATWHARLRRLPREAARSQELRKHLRETLGIIIVMEYTVPTYLRWVPERKGSK